MTPIRVGFLGCGGMQRHHIRQSLQREDVAVAALCDVVEAQTQRILHEECADRKPPPATFTDPAAMYRDTALDAVFIASPHTLHFEHGMQALDAGCHVFMEKPMVTNADHARRLAERVTATGRVLVVGYNTPCSPEFAYLRDQIRQRTLGRLELVVGHVTQDWKRPTKGSWRQQPELSGGGQAYDTGAHILNSVVWSIESDIDEVFALVDNMDTPVDINASINIRFANGVFASVVISGNCPASGAHMAFVFDDGKIEIDPWSGQWINVYDRAGRVKYPPIGGRAMWPGANFYDAIRGQAEPRTSPRNGIVQSDLMDAIYESARTGRPVRPAR